VKPTRSAASRQAPFYLHIRGSSLGVVFAPPELECARPTQRAPLATKPCETFLESLIPDSPVWRLDPRTLPLMEQVPDRPPAAVVLQVPPLTCLRTTGPHAVPFVRIETKKRHRRDINAGLQPGMSSKNRRRREGRKERSLEHHELQIRHRCESWSYCVATTKCLGSALSGTAVPLPGTASSFP
jgi:hypothetical protein